MTPFWGVQTYIILLLAPIFRFNCLAALVGIQVTNIFTAPFVYALMYKVGAWVYPAHMRFDFTQLTSLHSIFHLCRSLPEVIVILCIGGLIVGIPGGLAAQALLYCFLKRRQVSTHHDSHEMSPWRR